MDYISVALTANFTAVAATTLLLAIIALQAFTETWKRYLAIGILGQLIWSSSLLTSYITDINPLVLIHSELLRATLWLLALNGILSIRLTISQWPFKTKLIALSSVGICVSGYALALNQKTPVDALQYTLLVLTMLCLVTTEQVIRNLNSHRMIKLLGLSLTFLFSYDLFMRGASIVLDTTAAPILQGRSALAFVFASLLSLGNLIFNESKNHQNIFSVSRPAAFYSSTILASTIFILSVIFANIFWSNKSYLSTYLFSLTLIFALLLTVSLIISNTFRQNFEVFLSKHFFSLKYDYRLEWLNAIRFLSELNSEKPNYYEQVLDILKSALRSHAGSLWINSDSLIKKVSGELVIENQPNFIEVDEPFVKAMLKESWIFVPNSLDKSLNKNNVLLPDWIKNSTEIWVVAPLIIQMKIVGIVLLSKPRFDTTVTFEDRDLMTNISTQVASHLLLHQQEKVISDSRQMETYNRLSAFIMHDINNVIAQLALIGKNAEKHKDNPAFVTDMIKTVHHATTRMQGLIQKFNPSSKEKRTSFSASDIAAELVQEVSIYSPTPQVIINDDFIIHADRKRLLLALKNLVRNAQEVSPDNGSVRIIIRLENNAKIIVIEDEGNGMTQQFINEQLFRPFVTTKQENGVGIGAYLTKSYLEDIGASLRVSSTLKKGSQFEIAFS